MNIARSNSNKTKRNIHLSISDFTKPDNNKQPLLTGSSLSSAMEAPAAIMNRLEDIIEKYKYLILKGINS